MEDYSKQRNKPSTPRDYWGAINRDIILAMWRMQVQDVKRPAMTAMIVEAGPQAGGGKPHLRRAAQDVQSGRVWGPRPDGSNPCRHVPMYPPGKDTRLIVDDELVRIFRHVKKIEAEELEPEDMENYAIPLAIRLQLEFSGRRSEICLPEWTWLDFERRRMVCAGQQAGGISKPMSEEAYRLLSTAPRREGCAYVLPWPNDPSKHPTYGEYYGGWKRVLKAADVPHVGTHGIRHRAATGIANSGVPTKAGMALTGHKTVAIHDVHALRPHRGQAGA